ncbi:AAA family ATPase [Saccharopolyspora oryzae]|uniref:AAA family ATPase n=1 Tax=Saccharopolyspora oryzae TaxID=2997343 RepID=A0ABT4UXM4_9PSEU|nr:AAA family ATPase [Saccharopolyspora oryzae]MDA3626435.1 AAA family ATPase [Saccharopolyspora oryzae]
MLVHRAYIPDAQRPESFDTWPYTVPCVAELAERGLTFNAPVTMLVGENGSGKSTLVEALAESFKLDSHGGRAGRKYVNDRPKTPLGEVLALETTPAGRRMLTGPRTSRKGFFLRAETAFGLLNTISALELYGYWEEDTSTMSHGEGFLTVFESMFRERGFYVMDEPEAALSFESCLKLVALMHRLGETGAQVVCATHSPILAATPGADIVEVGEHGTRRTRWDELGLVDHWRRYLANPDSYLRHIVD